MYVNSSFNTCQRFTPRRRPLEEADPPDGSSNCDQERREANAARMRRLRSATAQNPTARQNNAARMRANRVEARQIAAQSLEQESAQSNEYDASRFPQLNYVRHMPAAVFAMRTYRKYVPQVHSLGLQDLECMDCGAQHFKCEPNEPGPNGVGRKFSSCCKKGLCQPSHIRPLPQELAWLLDPANSVRNHFVSNIVAYNNAMSFCSVKFNGDDGLGTASGLRSFVVSGEFYHVQGALVNNQTPSYAALYLLDPTARTSARFQANGGTLSRDILEKLDQLLHDCGNPFIELYQTAQEQIETNMQMGGDFSVSITSPEINLVVDRAQDPRRNNLPLTNEIVGVIPQNSKRKSGPRIMLFRRDQAVGPDRQWHYISSHHASYMALAYVLLFPYGDAGWDYSQRLNHPQNQVFAQTNPDANDDSLTQQIWYRYHMFRRDEAHGFGDLHKFGRLAQRYVVDAFIAIELSRLDWFRRSQRKIRADVYHNLEDSLNHEDVDIQSLGQKIILPATFTGGDRYMTKMYQNSMAIVRHFGSPTLFITMTASPQWQEFKDNLAPGITNPLDDPVLVAKVFNYKMKELQKDLKSIFGPKNYQAMVSSVEYQKRGLPHCHILLFLSNGDRFRDPVILDQFISAELPTETTADGCRLRSIVEKFMVHGPCGDLNPTSPCMKEGKDGKLYCSKKYPRTFQETTTISENGYPQYRRRDTGATFTKTTGGREIQIDNTWIVPHCPWLLLKYNCHINVELCETIKAVKYLHKYIHKGNDQITLEMRNDPDEIKRYVHCRHVSPAEATFRILEFHTHYQDPAVIQLTLHLENEHPVYFEESMTAREIQKLKNDAKTPLMGYFEYNTENRDARHLLFHEFPEYFVWNKDPPKKRWIRRKCKRAIGRMIFFSPRAGEKFYMRLLLTKVRGARSFQDLKTFNGVIHATYQEACLARGLIENDNEWIECFNEASLHTSGHGLRSMFVSALLQDGISRPLDLWTRFREAMCDDLPRLLDRSEDIHVPPGIPDVHLDYGLYLISRQLEQADRTLESYTLPGYVHPWDAAWIGTNPLIRDQLDYDRERLQQSLQENLPKLHEDQRYAYDVITSNIDRNDKHSYFLKGAGGTGKTFLYERVAEKYRAEGEIVLCVASSGIAALLLPGGTTAHSRFKIPLTCTSESICNIKQDSYTAELLKRTKLIIWDEATMQNKNNVCALDRSLRDILDCDDLFGGIPVLFGGDWAQTLPVVKHGSRQQTVNATLRTAEFWDQLEVLHLTKNQRLENGDDNAQWAKYIENLTCDESLRDTIDLPNTVNKFYDEDAFLQSVYPLDIIQSSNIPVDFFAERAVLAPHNSSCDSINATVLDEMHGEMQHFEGIDSVETSDDDYGEDFISQFNTELMASMDTHSLPPSCLRLKANTPVILMRNINPKAGLCNGTRLVITFLGKFYIKARIMSGDHKGEDAHLFRILLTTSEGEYPWILKRKQFPIRLAFAMTINKSQGQSMKFVGVDLRRECFSHGQLYVAFSRVTRVQNLTVLLDKYQKNKTANIVFPEVLLPTQNQTGAVAAID